MFRWLSGGLLLLALSVCMSVAAQAAFPNAGSAVPLRLAGGNEEEGYRYEQAGTGIGFDSIIMNDGSAYLELFEIDSGVYYELWCNGKQISYSNMQLIFQAGDYQLLIAASEEQRESNFSVFTFHILDFAYEEDKEALTVSYVNTYEMFGFSANDEPLFMLSVPNGGVSTEMVRLSLVSDTVSIEEYYFNAEIQRDTSRREFSEPGSYLLKMRIGLLREEWLAFRVLRTKDCTMTFLPLQQGITCLSPSDTLAGSTLYLPRDGSYHFRFLCPMSDTDMEWSNTLVRDTVLPGICFSENVASGRVTRKMHITALSPDAKVTVYRSDLELSPFDGSFDEDGRYQVVVTDRAGNTQEISFILYRLNRVLLTVAGLAGVLIILLAVSGFRQSRSAKW